MTRLDYGRNVTKQDYGSDSGRRKPDATEICNMIKHFQKANKNNANKSSPRYSPLANDPLATFDNCATSSLEILKDHVVEVDVHEMSKYDVLPTLLPPVVE